MKQLYASSYLFWVTSRIFLIIFGLIELWRIFTHYQNFIVTDLLAIIFLILLSIIFFGEITKSEPNMILKYIVGLATLCFGLFIVYYKLSEPVDDWERAANFNKFDYQKVLTYIFGTWLVFLGLFDFFKFSPNSDN